MKIMRQTLLASAMLTLFSVSSYAKTPIDLGVVNEVFKLDEVENIVKKYIEKILTSTPKSVEVLMKNIDKVSNLDILDSFSLEEEMGRELF